ncbi:hypothetical protein KJY73_10055 [Bowmanella sp. Y26]|uniref:hypothetical protein n=1 Tax=Bowmanella yangjiangensis TaxID=2811230 RepID=UPI001BDC87A6|nr:hypothetical protein [Bowmanella yangjiangensis]MBT1063917.1 hypothetical protein [Bowmanella yangjiangensis]
MVSHQKDFLSLKIRMDTLAKLISHHQLHIEDLRCSDSQSAALLRRLILECALHNVSAN